MDMTANTSAQIAGNARHETLDGRKYVIFPVVLIRAGVLNGELVPVEEIQKFTPAWDGRPLTVGHPMDGERYISANNPRIIARQVMGQIFNVHADGDRLKGEAWIDREKANVLGGGAFRALSMAERNAPLEVSTGYFRDVIESPGTMDGLPYRTIARNIRPDHLALLPDEEGACNWAAGCGLGRNSADQPGVIQKSLQSIAQLVNQMLHQSPADIKTNSSIVEARLMDKKQKVDAIIANTASPYTEAHRAFLEGQEDKFLDGLKPATETPAPVATPAQPNPATNANPCPCASTAANQSTPPAPPAGESAIVQALSKLTETVNGFGGRLDALEKRDPEKDSLIEQLSANEACPLEAEDMKVMSVEKLRTMHNRFIGATHVGNYGMRPVPAANAAKIEALPLPSLDFSTADDKGAK